MKSWISIFLVFFSIGVGLIVVTRIVGPDPFRNQARTVHVINETYGTRQ